ncbi:MAG: hypothetical protein IPK85_05670 [Gemmatimonadetes bacterium]|nr:hypothetical protein [Gemmatimonadota bacterium]
MHTADTAPLRLQLRGEELHPAVVFLLPRPKGLEPADDAGQVANGGGEGFGTRLRVEEVVDAAERGGVRAVLAGNGRAWWCAEKGGDRPECRVRDQSLYQ